MQPVWPRESDPAVEASFVQPGMQHWVWLAKWLNWPSAMPLNILTQSITINLRGDDSKGHDQTEQYEDQFNSKPTHLVTLLMTSSL